MATPLLGTSPNPGTTLSYPMSYPPAQRNASYERSHMGANPLKRFQDSPSTLGTRYDPVRHSDFPPQKTNLPLSSATSGNVYSPILHKRKRSDSQGLPAHGYQSPESEEGNADEYQYEPQKLVTPTNSLQSGKRNHVCDLCGATFTRQHNLKSHFLTHTSSKKEYICTACGSEFRRSHDLKRHQKLHTGEKPFACPNCGRKFARADALGRHTKSSGEGGCVNSRKTTSDPGSTSNTNYQLPSPATIHDARGDRHTRRSSMASAVGSERYGDSQRDPDAYVQQQSESGQLFPQFDSSTSYEPADRPFHHGQDTSHVGRLDELTNSRRLPQTTLPPLQTGFAFDHGRPPHVSNSGPMDGYLSSAGLGISSNFDASRPPATHPLSFDRGSAPEGSSSQLSPVGLLSCDSSTVPLDQYRQLQAKHREVVEKLRHFESSSPTSG